ncbi:DUF302 domain-containing protein [Mycolicibacterium sp. P9-64]|uniref:DUF302 domain-containing protein n=1 Tax=Mycolicibacterium sp. P9-64 TaxID=2024612 RepID=UPI0011EF56D2|nr:DUF302 domain-containing protein [Mycolicibacterium sp. P9-64]KAA0086937.1 DUF302 domain-containing protein [Mycolicibacterium sp. P9-64]
MSTEEEVTVAVRRVTVTSQRPYDDVVAAVYAGLGRVPDFGQAVRDWYKARDRGEFDALVEPVAGSSGLLEFLSLDLGNVLAIRDPDRSGRLLRIIAGNPVTMSKMTATVRDAGSYAPVTILVAERPDGVTVSYDRVASQIAPYAGSEASAIAEALDDAVVTLIRNAAG